MKYSVLLMTALASALALVGCNKADKSAQAKAQAQQQMPPATVNVVPVQFQAVPLVKSLSGKTVAYQEAIVVPQVSGIVDKQFFREGSFVKQGQELYQLNADSYASGLAGSKATYNQAVASIGTAKANVKAQQSALNLALANLKRLEQLKGSNAISAQEYDVGVANVNSARSALESAQAQVASAEANAHVAQQNINSNQLNYNRTRVKAPLSGITGRSLVNVGTLATQGQTQMVTISQLNPIYVDMSQSSAELLTLRQQMASGAVSGARGVRVRLKLADGSIYPVEGQLRFEEAKVDANTGTVNLRAVFSNDDFILLPGMMVGAELIQGVVNNAMLLPQSAINRTPTGETTVYVVDINSKIQVRPVKVQGTYEGKWIVTDGLQQGENVVVVGGAKVKPEQQVKVAPFVASAPAPTNMPANAQNAPTAQQNAPASIANQPVVKKAETDSNAQAPQQNVANTSDNATTASVPTEQPASTQQP